MGGLHDAKAFRGRPILRHDSIAITIVMLVFSSYAPSLSRLFCLTHDNTPAVSIPGALV